MHKLTAFPLGNADTTRIDLASGKKLLFDYAHVSDPANKADKRIDLPKELRQDLKAANRTSYDVVAFSHLDRDHFQRSSEFFYFDHDTKYQGKFEGNERIKIDELWVPAAALVKEESNEEAKIIQAEARHRFKVGKGIRVFSNPISLTEWLDKNKINDAAHLALITNAGELVPGFTLDKDSVEFFVHSPHASRTGDGTLLNCNDDGLALQATFQDKHPISGIAKKTRVQLLADIGYKVIADIVKITEYHAKNKKGTAHLERLWWDVIHLPHHTSYKSLGPDKGKDITVPDDDVKRLYETYGQANGIIISPSDIIPAYDTDQPPHRQAAAYYKTLNAKNKVEYKVTMEQPTKEAPKPMVLKIDYLGVTLEKADITGAPVILTKPTPRAGSTR